MRVAGGCWDDVRVVAHPGTTMALAKNVNGLLVIIIQNDAGYWPEGLEPIPQTIQTIPLGQNSFQAKHNPK